MIHFNTSHVSVQDKLYMDKSWNLVISIHLMYQFKADMEDFLGEMIRFQYISCISSSSKTIQEVSLQPYFNTSHVSVQENPISRCPSCSNISIHLMYQFKERILGNFTKEKISKILKYRSFSDFFPTVFKFDSKKLKSFLKALY